MKNNLFLYKQIPAKVSANFDRIMHDWQQTGLPIKHILELYNRVRSKKKGINAANRTFPSRCEQNYELEF